MPSPSTDPADDLLEQLTALGAPAWYLQAVSHPTASRRVEISPGLWMNCVFWNEAEATKPPLLLVHGYRANARAWHAVAPSLTPHFRVIAVDLMGMGESDSRDGCGDRASVGEDLAAAIGQLGIAPVTVVGHSFGGACSIHLAHRHPALVSRLVVVDSTLLFPETDQEHGKHPLGPPRLYPDRSSIVARYRLLPPQPCPPWSLIYMAHRSIRQVPEGWVWQFDPALPTAQMSFDTALALRHCSMRVDYVYGEHSKSSNAPRRQLIEEAIRPAGCVIAVPQAHHHVMLDQPMALVETLRQLLI